jgi:hypothetical protein
MAQGAPREESPTGTDGERLKLPDCRIGKELAFVDEVWGEVKELTAAGAATHQDSIIVDRREVKVLEVLLSHTVFALLSTSVTPPVE